MSRRIVSVSCPEDIYQYLCEEKARTGFSISQLLVQAYREKRKV